MRPYIPPIPTVSSATGHSTPETVLHCQLVIVWYLMLTEQMIQSPEHISKKALCLPTLGPFSVLFTGQPANKPTS
jgi:hypothetical protein